MSIAARISMPTVPPFAAPAPSRRMSGNFNDPVFSDERVPAPSGAMSGPARDRDAGQSGRAGFRFAPRGSGARVSRARCPRRTRRPGVGKRAMRRAASQAALERTVAFASASHRVGRTGRVIAGRHARPRAKRRGGRKPPTRQRHRQRQAGLICAASAGRPTGRALELVEGRSAVAPAPRGPPRPRNGFKIPHPGLPVHGQDRTGRYRAAGRLARFRATALADLLRAGVADADRGCGGFLLGPACGPAGKNPGIGWRLARAALRKSARRFRTRAPKRRKAPDGPSPGGGA